MGAGLRPREELLKIINEVVTEEMSKPNPDPAVMRWVSPLSEAGARILADGVALKAIRKITTNAQVEVG